MRSHKANAASSWSHGRSLISASGKIIPAKGEYRYKCIADWRVFSVESKRFDSFVKFSHRMQLPCRSAPKVSQVQAKSSQKHSRSCPRGNCKSRTTLRILALNIRLRTTLRRLPIIVLALELLLRLAVTGEARVRAAHRARHPIANPGPQVAQLALRLLRLALAVLLDPCLLHAVRADQVAEALLGRADGLVPGPLGAVGRVLAHAAGAGHGEWPDLADRVR